VRRVAITAVALTVLLIFPAAALACPKTSLTDIADEVMCIQCGVPLNLSEQAPAAKRERAFIQRLVDQCKSKDEIKAALVEQFGDGVLAEPKGGAAWIVPGLAVGGGVVLIGFAALRWRRRQRGGASGPPSEPAVASGPDAARLQRDIDRYDL
jgi:cytochrome c-type biogenesis protein CcmH